MVCESLIEVYHCIFAVLPCFFHGYTMHLPLFTLVCHNMLYKTLIFFTMLIYALQCFPYVVIPLDVLLLWEMFIRGAARIFDVLTHDTSEIGLPLKTQLYLQESDILMLTSTLLKASVVGTFNETVCKTFCSVKK